MTTEQLDGKIEGLATALAYLIADFEQRGIINGPRFSQMLLANGRHNADIAYPSEYARYHAMTLHNLAVTLDGARSTRAMLSDDD